MDLRSITLLIAILLLEVIVQTAKDDVWICIEVISNFFTVYRDINF